MGRSSTHTKQKVKAILTLTPTERIAQGHPVSFKEIADAYNIYESTVKLWHEEVYTGKGETSDTFDTLTFLRGKKEEIIEALVSSAIKGNHNAQKLILEISGEYTPKQEVTHKIDGRGFAEIYFEARRELEAEGMGQVQRKSKVFSDKLRLSTGQGEEGDSEVRVLATPDATDGYVPSG